MRDKEWFINELYEKEAKRLGASVEEVAECL